ncbi:MAG: HD domain-containing protein [Candidatus Hydrogenedentes bacterium]|nr:HD domain-containing protein [Candidatus Hydrogenedentota bacterium]
MKRERIVVQSAPYQGKLIDIKGKLTIGRNPDCTFQVADLQVSRQHAIIEQTPAGTIIRDLGSGNGTYIGNRRILECRLSDGDVIKIGSIEIRFEGYESDSTPADVPSSGVRFNKDATGSLQANDAQNVYQTFFRAPKDSASADQLKSAQARLAAVYEACRIIISERDLKHLFSRVMDQVFTLVPAHSGVILLRDAATGELITEYVKSGLGAGAITISSTIVSRACDHGEAVITYNAADDSRFDAGASIIAQNISSAMCAPLAYQDETLGVVYVDTRGTTNAFVQSDLEMLVALAGPAAIAIKNAQYVAKLEKAYHDTLIVVANAVEARDHYTVGHTWRVTNFALAMAHVLGWPEDDLKRCEMGGVLHDVGKIAIEDAILRKPGGLTDEEFAKMKVHPERGARIMRDSDFLVPMIPYALYHHERYDGKGYPYGLKGDEIPIEGRLLAVADTFDAMTSNRPYRKGLDPEIAIAEIQKGSGTQFDPTCVEAMLKAYREGSIVRVLQDYFKDAKSVACPFCSTYVTIPEGAELDSEFECAVCHRHLRLKEQNNAFYGELIAGTEARHNPTPLPAPPTHKITVTEISPNAVKA